MLLHYFSNRRKRRAEQEAERAQSGRRARLGPPAEEDLAPPGPPCPRCKSTRTCPIQNIGLSSRSGPRREEIDRLGELARQGFLALAGCCIEWNTHCKDCGLGWEIDDDGTVVAIQPPDEWVDATPADVAWWYGNSLASSLAESSGSSQDETGASG